MGVYRFQHAVWVVWEGERVIGGVGGGEGRDNGDLSDLGEGRLSPKRMGSFGWFGDARGNV